MKDADLLKILYENTSYGIEVAIDTYGKAVKTICQTILSGFSEEDVEEAVSDTFVGLWKALDRIKLERETGLKEYLYGIARRTALNKRRKLAKEHNTSQIDEVKELVSEQDVEKNLIDKAECRIIYELINDMKSPDKEIFTLRYFNQNTIKEIANKLVLKTKTVENKLARGKVKLRKQLINIGIELV